MDIKRIGKRIEKERKRAGLTLEKLAQMAGYNNYQTLRKIEKGEKNITMTDLLKISRALGLHVDYFLSEEEENPVFVWREKNKDIEKSRTRKYEYDLQRYMDNYSLLLRLKGVKYPEYEIPQRVKIIYESSSNDYEFSQRLSDWVRDDYMMLGNYPGQELLLTIADKGIIVFAKSLGDAGSAVSTIYKHKAGILINYEDDPWRLTFDIAHELFHILTWDIYDYKNMNEERYNEIEKFANAFAANLLVPKVKIEEAVEKYGNIDEFFIIKEAVNFKVSIDVICNRLEFLGLLDKSRSFVYKNNDELKKQFYHLFKLKYSEDNYFIKIKNVLFPLDYFLNVWQMYGSGKVSKMKAAHILDLNIGELDWTISTVMG